MTLPSNSTFSPRRQPGATALAVLAALAFVDSLFEYVSPANGIHGTEGALLVVASTFLMAAAAVLLLTRSVHRGLRLTFEILIFIDIWCTGLAAYFLENWVLLVLSVLALLAFLAQVIRLPRRNVREAM